MKTANEIRGECRQIRRNVHPDFHHRLAFNVSREEMATFFLDQPSEYLTVDRDGQYYYASIPLVVLP